MSSKYKMLNLATILFLLIALSSAVESSASSMDIIPDGVGIDAGNASTLTSGLDAASQKIGYSGVISGLGEVGAGGDIIPADRRIDWSYCRHPRGYPKTDKHLRHHRQRRIR